MQLLKNTNRPTLSVALIFFFILLTIFASCGKGGKKSISAGTAAIKVDTADVVGTYNKIKEYDAATIDSFYSGLVAELRKKNQYDLLLGHIDYYQTLNGKNKRTLAYIANAKGYAYNYLAKYDSAYSFFQEAERLYKELDATADLADTYVGLATNYIYKGDYAMAFNNHYKSLGIYERLKDSGNIYRVKSEMAIDLYYQKEFQKAITTALACQSYYKRSNEPDMLAYSQSILATLYYNTGDYPTSVEYAQASLAIRKQLGIEHDIAESLNNLALPYMALKQWDKAVVSLQEALERMQRSNDIRQIPIIKQNLASCIWRKGDASEAERLLMEVVDEATKSGQKDAIANAYKKLSNLFKEKEDFATALKYYQKYKSWSDSLYSYEKEQAISELNIKYETNKKEAQIARLNDEKRLNSVMQIVFVILLLSTIIVATLTTLYLTSRNRKNKLMLEKVSLELEMNKKDLTHFTESVITKNKLIGELETKLQTISTERAAIEENNESLSELYRFKILTEDDWRQFKIYFDKVYPGLIHALREKYPDLTPAEERQFLLITLNINNKESADMLGISLASIKKNRYRLKKRFDLTEQDDLDAFVKNFHGTSGNHNTGTDANG